MQDGFIPCIAPSLTLQMHGLYWFKVVRDVFLHHRIEKGQARSMQYHIWYLQMFKTVKSRFCANPRCSIASWLHYLSKLPCTDKACDLWLQLLKANCVQTNTLQISLGSSGWCWWSSVWRVDKICQSLVSLLYIWKKHVVKSACMAMESIWFSLMLHSKSQRV